MGPLLCGVITLVQALLPAEGAASCGAEIPMQPLTNILGANQPGAPVLTSSATACQAKCCSMNVATKPQRCGGFVWVSTTDPGQPTAECEPKGTPGEGCCYLKTPGCPSPLNKTQHGGSIVGNYTTLVAGVAPHVAPPPPLDGPRVHFTPPPWIGQPTGGDIAGALFHPQTKQYHVMPLSHDGWAHCVTSDLVTWTFAGGGAVSGLHMESGGMIFDQTRNETVAFADSPTNAFTSADPTLLSKFESVGVLFSPKDPLNPGGAKGGKGMGCWDPVMWRDERTALYYAASACGHCDPGDQPYQNGSGIHCSGGEGLEVYWSSPAISGVGMNWTLRPNVFLEEKQSAVPRVGSWPRPHEFVTPDYFAIPPAASNTGTSAIEKYGFLTTSYGDMRWTGLPTTPQTAGLCYDYANYYIGDRPSPGGTFAPDLAMSAPFDWSPFRPVDDSASKNLTFATTKGMEQFGCCPKTAGDNQRRVLFGWLNNGWNQGGSKAQPGLPNNTLTLPRDLTATARGQLRQRFVPELQKLREAHTHVVAQALPSGGIGQAKLIGGAAGLQLEIIARFKKTPASSTGSKDNGGGKFGLVVLASADKSERTAVTFDPAREQLLLDRSQSGAAGDCDVRGGPWPQGDGSAAGVGEAVTVHIYVDHQVVELISFREDSNASAVSRGGNSDNNAAAVESTAISAWVQPTSTASDGVGVWAEAAGGWALESMDIWQLKAPTHSERI